ncbi:unnamed protein product, partial [Urochloa humidicola]
ARDYGHLISDGFLLEWPRKQECETCTRRGGECRFVSLAFQCFCPAEGLLCSQDERKKHKIMLILIVVLFAAAILIPTWLVWMYRQTAAEVGFSSRGGSPYFLPPPA